MTLGERWGRTNSDGRKPVAGRPPSCCRAKEVVSEPRASFVLKGHVIGGGAGKEWPQKALIVGTE